MVEVKTLDRKLIRDLARIWAQALAIATVMACGVATIILAVGAYRSLEATRDAFYERYRFATVFASVTRAPLHLLRQIEAIPGVLSVEVRVQQAVVLDVPGMKEPATGLAISIPDFNPPSVNRLYLRKGRFPEPARNNEIAVVETFANAHQLSLGDSFEAVINGRKQALSITGIVLSPEYIYALGPGDMVPDQRRFGVFYMSSGALSGLFDMEGAFDSVVLTTQRNTDIDRVIDRLDAILKPYGGSGAYGRIHQTSHAFLDSELEQLNGMALVIPPIFLFVSAFLVNMILSRMVALEREQIGLLKAIGYSRVAIGWHYAKLVIVISLIGVVFGALAGLWLGQGLTRMFADFYSFPFLIFRNSADLYIISGGVTVAAALAGALKAIFSVVQLPPAVAMSPPAPPAYQRLFSGGQWQSRLFSQLTVMALRHIYRWPLRSLLTTLGTSMSVALLITAMFSFDSIDAMVDTIFFQADRQDATLSFTRDRGMDAVSAARRMPGVLHVEPYRVSSAVIRHAHLEKRISIMALPSNAGLSRILDLDLRPIEAPASGLLLPQHLARQLNVRPGDFVQLELLEQNRRRVRVAVSAVVESYVGLAAHMSLDGLNRLMRDGNKVSGVRVLVDDNELLNLYARIKNTPAVSSIALQNVSRTEFRKIIEQNIATMTKVYIVLAVIITFGVIYNSARIQLSERARELASLRVFGFTRAEVSSVMLTELALIVLLAQPLGWVLGYLFSWSVIEGFKSDLFRIPFVVNPSTFSTASMVVLIAAAVSALIVRRRIDNLDLVRVLKTRE